MKARSFTIVLVAIGVFVTVAFGQDFDPKRDGWYFVNWGEKPPNCVGSCDFSWDLYRHTYLGINPTHDCVQAPLDCAFYEIFKNCAKNGNCGGMSLLALALFKYGGYFGFCSPASFYSGTTSPDRTDLHQAINIMQARQFSAAGIENFIDVVDAGNLNNAVAAFHTIRDAIARGDYPVLSIANSALGEDAHTVIPYKVVDGSPKKIYIWDPNLPYDDNKSHYDSGANIMTINSATDWNYVQGSLGTYSGSGSSGAWCFAIPMSIILPKSRQPMALDMVFDALQSIFISGPGAAVSQISDDQGRQFYKTDADVHVLGNDLETDPAKRLRGAVRWRWPSQTAANQPPGELYFIRRTIGPGSSLNFTLSGSQYKALIGAAGNLVQIEAKSSSSARDKIRISNLAGAAQKVEVETLGSERIFSIKQLRADVRSSDWRSIELKDLRIVRNVPVSIEAVGDLETVLVSSSDQSVTFDLDLQQRIKGQFANTKANRLSTTPGKLLRIAPEDWNILDRAQIAREVMDRTAVDLRAVRIAAPLITPELPTVTTEQATTTPELPKPLTTTASAGEFQRLTDLEFKVDSVEVTESAIRNQLPPDGYQYIVVTLSTRNPQSREVRFDESGYIARLYNAAGKEIRWNGVFLGERGDTGMSMVDIKPGVVLHLRVYFTVPNGTKLSKFALTAKTTGRSLTVDLTTR